jgi:hypothetical protein
VTQEALFTTMPEVGEHWARPGEDRLVIVHVWNHDLYDGQPWVHAEQGRRDQIGTSGPVESFLARGYRRVK